MNRKIDVDLTSHNILSSIIAMVVPQMISNILQMIYTSADIMIVGKFGEYGAVGAIGTATTLINCFINLFIGFSVGANVLMAKEVGAQNYKDIKRIACSSLCFGSISGVVCGLLGLIFLEELLLLLGTTGIILAQAEIYCKIIFSGTVFVSVTNFLVSLFRANGDTKTPLYVLTIAGVLNVMLNLMLIQIMERSVTAVATATVIANLFSSIVLFILFNKKYLESEITLFDLKMSTDDVIEIFKIGFPAGIQNVLGSITNMFIQSSILKLNSIYCSLGHTDVADGHSASGSIEAIAYTAINSMNVTSATIISAVIGARRKEKIKEVIKSCYFVGGFIAVALATVILPLHKRILGLFSLNSFAYNIAYTRLIIQLVPYFLLAWVEVGTGLLRGMGKSQESVIAMFFGCVLIRILWIIFIFNKFPSIEVLYLVFPISWLITAVIQLVMVRINQREIVQNL